ncbi:MAG: 5'-methylthioadenosine/adenosylhomocysteine nucleosidase [Candidatus Zixiibacteriota bacterium]
MIGLLSAMEEETELFRHHLQATSSVTIASVEFHVGTLQGVEVVLGRCGVGKVHAASAVQAMIDKFAVSVVIFTGLAGTVVPYLKRGDVVISNFVGQHDFDLTAFGKRPGQVTEGSRLIEADPKLVQLAAKAYEDSVAADRIEGQMVVGTVVTGDSFVADETRIKWLQREFGAVAAEMEGAAVGQVCQANKVPFVVIRVISDGASGSAAGEFIMFLDEASELSYSIVSTMLPRIMLPTRKPVHA